MKKFKEFMLGTSLIWIPMLGCYIAEAISNILINLL